MKNKITILLLLFTLILSSCGNSNKDTYTNMIDGWTLKLDSLHTDTGLYYSIKINTIEYFYLKGDTNK